MFRFDNGQTLHIYYRRTGLLRARTSTIVYDHNGPPRGGCYKYDSRVTPRDVAVCHARLDISL